MFKIKRKGEAGQPTSNTGHFAQKTHDDDETVRLSNTRQPRPEFVPSLLHRAPVGSTAARNETPSPMRSARPEPEPSPLQRARAARAASAVEPEHSFGDAAADTTDEDFFIDFLTKDHLQQRSFVRPGDFVQRAALIRARAGIGRSESYVKARTELFNAIQPIRDGDRRRELVKEFTDRYNRHLTQATSVGGMGHTGHTQSFTW